MRIRSNKTHLITKNSNGDAVYLCNHAVTVNKQKVNLKNPTCKNCLKLDLVRKDGGLI